MRSWKNRTRNEYSQTKNHTIVQNMIGYVALLLSYLLFNTTSTAWSMNHRSPTVKLMRNPTVTELYDGLQYTKGAEIFPPCNQKDFSLADSFPGGSIPPLVADVLKEQGFDADALKNVQDARVKYDSLSRRNFLVGASGIILGGTVSSFINKHTISQDAQGMTVEDAVRWIDENGDRRLLHAVVASNYKFLYRGISDEAISRQIHFESSERDLLVKDTYGSQQSVDWFQNLEHIMEKELVKSSNGDLCTTSIADASKWGIAVSIWPMKGAHYAWFEDKGPFYPRSKTISRNDLIVDGKDCGKDSFEDALKAYGCEIMIATDGYLAVPSSMDEDFRESLKRSYLV